jgi:hypothetical protein
MSDEKKIEVRCMARADGVIQIETQWPGLDDTVREIMNTKNRMTRDALIALGWTPPQEAAPRGNGEACAHGGGTTYRGNGPQCSLCGEQQPWSLMGKRVRVDIRSMYLTYEGTVTGQGDDSFSVTTDDGKVHRVNGRKYVTVLDDAPPAAQASDFDAWHDAKWPEPAVYAHKVAWRSAKRSRREVWEAAVQGDKP